MLKKIFSLLLISFLLLSAVVLFNTFNTSAVAPEKVAAFELKLDRTAVSDRLSKAIQIRTISQQDPQQRDDESFLELHKLLEDSFPLVHEELKKERINELSLLYRWPGSNPQLKPILLMAHQDVVPVNAGTLDQWLFPPYEGAIDETYIWGRGTLDNKSGVIAILESVERLLQLKMKPKRTIYLAFGHDEEVGGREGAAAIAAHLEKQGVTLEFTLDEGGAIIKDQVIPGIDTPIALIGIAEKGYVTLEVTTKGASGHSSMPPQQTAAGKLALAVAAIEANPLPADLSYIQMMFGDAITKLPFVQRMALSNSWLFAPVLDAIMSSKSSTNAAIRTTTAVTMLNAGVKENVLPSTATATVNFRTLPNDDAHSIIDHLKTATKLDDSAFKIKGDHPASSVSATNSQAFKTISTTIHEVINDPELIVSPYLVVGGTDSKHFEKVSIDQYRFIPFSFDPEEQKRFHGINERISIEDYTRMIKFYFKVLQSYAF